MKKRIITALCAVTIMSFAGCAQQGVQFENIDTKDVISTNDVKQSDFTNDLDGLEKYFIKLRYIPEKTEPTEMLYKVIGAKDGDRYIFNVNGTNVAMELYEYDTDNLNEDAKRVLDEIKETGKFHVFKNKDIDGDNTYPAVISDNGKYMMIYNDPSKETQNITQKNVVELTFKSYYKDNKPVDPEPSKTEESSAESKEGSSKD